MVWKVIIEEWCEEDFETRKEAFEWAERNIDIEEGRDYSVKNVKGGLR